MRRSFGKVIADLADIDENIYVLVGDIGYRVFDAFRLRHPNRFINMGICEQSIIGVSAGMALEGLKPWVYTITPHKITVNNGIIYLNSIPKFQKKLWKY